MMNLLSALLALGSAAFAALAAWAWWNASKAPAPFPAPPPPDDLAAWNAMFKIHEQIKEALPWNATGAKFASIAAALAALSALCQAAADIGWLS